MRLLYRLKSTRQMTKITRLTRVLAGGADEEEDEDKEDEEEDEDEEDPEWDVIQEQVEAGKIKIKVQVGNRNKQVMQPQLKPYQAGRNFKPIFIVDITRD